jgi:thioredoxin-dependent peroxiredoxin
MTLKIGDKAPDFVVNDQDGKNVSLRDFLGKNIVLYFYPKDDTPGCTKEACGLRDDFSLLTEKGIVILGVSKDDESSHQKFIDKFKLPFQLLADTSLDICKKYGVWGKKKFMGKEYMGISRTTFLIDKKGNIKHVFEKVKPERHSKDILDLFS